MYAGTSLNLYNDTTSRATSGHDHRVQVLADGDDGYHLVLSPLAKPHEPILTRKVDKPSLAAFCRATLAMLGENVA